MAYRFRVVLFLFLSVFVFPVNAAVPLVSGIYIQSSSNSGPYDRGPFFSYPEACTAYFMALSSVIVDNVPLPTDRVENARQDHSYCLGTIYYTMPDGTQKSLDRRSQPWVYELRNSCPTNSVQSGTQCVCNEGYEEKNGNSCELPQPPDPCEGLDQYCASMQHKTADWEAESQVLPSFLCMKPNIFVPVVGGGPGSSYFEDKFPGCNRGCLLQTTGNPWSYKDHDDKWFAQGSGVYQAGSCDPKELEELEDPKAPTPDNSLKVEPPKNHGCKVGEYVGQVNGVNACIPPKESSGKLEHEVKDNGDGTQTTTEKNVKCENGICTIKSETVTKEKETNNIISNSSVETQVSQDAFCVQNPKAGVCKGESGGKGDGEEGEGGSFGGTCESGFECEGDAVQCAIAKNQHETNCALLKEAPAGSVPDGTEEGSAEDLKNKAGVINVQTDLDYSGMGWNRSCPADEDIDLGFTNGKMTIPYSKICVILSPMSDIALAITALALLGWLVSGKKEG